VPRLVFEVVEGPHAGLRSTVVTTPLRVGREPGNDIELPDDPLVSRRHARLSPVSDGVIVEDLGSRNGTFVEGNEIHSPSIIGPGAQVTLGTTVLELRTTEAAAVATAVRTVPPGLVRVRASSSGSDSVHPVVGGLASAEQVPDYLAPPGHAARSQLSPLLDVHTKRMARTAPIAIGALVSLVVITALALR
jgi:pSer/pThr/pTyr-binding forkhead associated (FHA) protein